MTSREAAEKYVENNFDNYILLPVTDLLSTHLAGQLWMKEKILGMLRSDDIQKSIDIAFYDDDRDPIPEWCCDYLEKKLKE